MEVNSKKEYYLGLDILRVVLMLLGIAIHAKYFVGFLNPLYEENGFKNMVIENSVYFVQIFRMDAFFAISGFFSSYVLINNGKKAFKGSRLNRVLYPFLFAYLLIIPIGIKFLDNPNNLAVYHLWFLVVLLMFSLVDYSFNLDFHLKKLVSKKALFGMILVALVMVSYIFIYVDYMAKNDLVKLFLYQFFKYLPFYILGKYLYLNRTMISSIKISVLGYLFVFICIVTSLYLYDLRLKTGEGYFFLSKGRMILSTLTSTLIVLVLFVVTINVKGKPSKILRYFVDSSLVVYLFHFPFIHAIGLNVKSNLFFSNSWVYFFTLIIVTFIFSITMFEVLKRIKVGRFMFGIKQNK